MKRTIRLTESDIRNIIKESVKGALKESFEDDYNNARQNYNRQLWGFEMKNPDGEWEYGDITYDPKTQTMSCMGVTIDVDPDMTVDQNLEGLYDELISKGYNNESRIRGIVRESIKRVLKEDAGHLYGHYDDDTPFTNSTETYRGVPGTTFISHGEWSDPEIWYDGVELNANDVEEGLWYTYKDVCEENGETPTEQGYEQWLDENPDYIESQLQDCVWAAQGNP